MSTNADPDETGHPSGLANTEGIRCSNPYLRALADIYSDRISTASKTKDQKIYHYPDP